MFAVTDVATNEDFAVKRLLVADKSRLAAVRAECDVAVRAFLLCLGTMCVLIVMRDDSVL